MNCVRMIIALTFLTLGGCSDHKTTPKETTFDPTDYPTDIQPLLAKLDSLVGKYNSETRSIELSQHGVDGHLKDETASQLAELANAILNELNNSFDEPVARIIGETWYQVPSRFMIAETESHDGISATFTISHHNCGVHEYDFIVDGGIGIVVAHRYDSLGINW